MNGFVLGLVDKKLNMVDPDNEETNRIWTPINQSYLSNKSVSWQSSDVPNPPWCIGVKPT